MIIINNVICQRLDNLGEELSISIELTLRSEDLVITALCLRLRLVMVKL